MPTGPKALSVPRWSPPIGRQRVADLEQLDALLAPHSYWWWHGTAASATNDFCIATSVSVSRYSVTNISGMGSLTAMRPL